jgi:peptidyl-prolyl cis-trans isomerase C
VQRETVTQYIDQLHSNAKVEKFNIDGTKAAPAPANPPAGGAAPAAPSAPGPAAPTPVLPNPAK